MSNKFALLDILGKTAAQAQNNRIFGGRMSPEHEKSISRSMDTTNRTQVDESAQGKIAGIGLPAHVAGSGALDRLVDTARDYASAAASDNTLKGV